MKLKVDRIRDISVHEILRRIDESPRLCLPWNYCQEPIYDLDRLITKPVIQLDDGRTIGKYLRHKLYVGRTDGSELLSNILLELLGEPSRITSGGGGTPIYNFISPTGDSDRPMERTSIKPWELDPRLFGSGDKEYHRQPNKKDIELFERLRDNGFSFARLGHQFPEPKYQLRQ